MPNGRAESCFAESCLSCFRAFLKRISRPKSSTICDDSSCIPYKRA